ncbi:histidine phosphatase family protein [uncultured Lentibacter sp.]|uniref:histidine phosphatase family protein n=1 Tax=uncultured Lentibacter sp. TaxID=1659309 RepID=UPI00260468DC|nr:histidine phosphatase family protein [uncultured Lentibacter sp.]
MPTLLLIRHAQASFGAADYDKLSELGHAQSRALGQALKALGLVPDAVCLGAQRRHAETWEGINQALGHTAPPRILPGFNEFDFGGLLEARYAGRPRPDKLHTDRRAHFKALRETVLEWQRGEITDPPESYAAFTARVRAARTEAMREGHETVLVVSSGGAIGQTVGEIMGAPADAMIRLQLQIKNCAMSRLIITPRAAHLSSFNETPHITAANEARLLTYS